MIGLKSVLLSRPARTMMAQNCRGGQLTTGLACGPCQEETMRKTAWITRNQRLDNPRPKVESNTTDKTNEQIYKW